jgi:hypothetical protein
MNNKVWIRHAGLNVTLPLGDIFWREDFQSICVDFNKGKSQVNIFLAPKALEFFKKRLPSLVESSGDKASGSIGPIPATKEVEEAMDIMAEFDNLVASCHGGYLETDPEFKPCFGKGCPQAISAVRAVIKDALRPKVVSREWVEELVEVARWGDKDGGYARVKSRLCSELGVVVGD